MGIITIRLDDAVDQRLREYEFRVYKGKGKRKTEIINKAVTEFLDKYDRIT